MRIMLKGIDISNWQAGIDLSKLDIDFVICKATEGNSFVDKYCDEFITKAKSLGKLWGFYHFARSNSPEAEAEFFYKNTKGYIENGIPVLDYEVWGQNKDVSWCEKFIQKFYDLTGIYCMLYISASHCKDFKGSWIPSKCGLWVAGYPKNYTEYPGANMPYNVAPWQIVAIWQFTSSLKLSGFNGNLDGNYAYMDANGWSLYAGKGIGGSNGNIDLPNYDKLADEVINGKWGNGNERKSRLDVAYGLGTYDKVQKLVNEKLAYTPDYAALADEVIAGKWGNGWNREQALNNAYGAGTYERVQKIVNEKLK